jgi:hypothetical protein
MVIALEFIVLSCSVDALQGRAAPANPDITPDA